MDALIYRSSEQTIALMDQLFQQVLPNILRKDPPRHVPADNWLHLLQQSTPNDPQIRLVPVILDLEPPTKSGPLVCRLYRRHMRINDDWMIWPWQVEEAAHKGINTFIFVDDFLGTGIQFKQFADRFSFASKLQGCYCIYAPWVAHKSGIDFLKKEISTFKFAMVEFLDESYNLFADSSPWFQDGKNNPQIAKDYYYHLLSIKKIDVMPSDRTGFGKLSLAYSFEHATPDNCIPLLWYKYNGWNPLFER